MTATDSRPRPNIVYILADDMGYGDMGCNNAASRIPTPHLDRLATQGIRFTDAHASSSVCTPSRYSILTGRYCWRSPLKRSVLWPWDGPLIEPGRATVATLLADAGYRTACIGKWHLGWNWRTLDGRPAAEGLTAGLYDGDRRRDLAGSIDFDAPLAGGPVDCGFDSYFGVDVPNFPPYTWFEDNRVKPAPTEQKPPGMFGFPGPMAPGWSFEAVMPEITNRAVQYIEQSDDRPFFLFFALTAPHTPIAPTDEFKGCSGAGPYGDFVCQVDHSVGQVMAALERRGIAGNTLLVFTSDNGPECWSQQTGGYAIARQYGHYSMGHLRGAKRDTWEGGHRVPLLVRWPEVAPSGVVCDQLVELGDLFATCADIIGRQPPATAEDSVSMLSLLQGRFESPTRLFMVHNSCSGHFAIRRGDWVFIDNPTGQDKDNNEPQWFKDERGYVPHDQPGELFNLRQDISERANLYAEQPEVVAQLRRLLRQVQGGDAPGAPASNVGRQSE